MLGQTRDGAALGLGPDPVSGPRPGGLAPQSISSPLARDLVALVRSVGVLRASAGTVGRRASLNPTLLLLVHRHDAGAVRASVGFAQRKARRGDAGSLGRQRVSLTTLGRWPGTGLLRPR